MSALQPVAMHFQCLANNIASASKNVTTFVFLHGLLGSFHNFRITNKMLLDKYKTPIKIYSLDIRNHGKSPHTSTHTYDEMCADLKLFLDDQSIDSAVIVGLSMGGKMAMKFALNHPNRVSKLVSIDGEQNS
eukprot:TRINITY_DN6931_c0_g2_i2.p1 TRINITY_DN6931_c0_g2~~TRINITY_DN6931_c0_g2_i2.p1  ORF type:complete len:146 (-),score=14.81 TRINITY_DN6931_c0_g2_i2:810-1205(-)